MFTVVLVVIAYLLAGFVKGVVGMGLPTVAIGILAIVLTPAQAAAILIAPSLATNIWQALAGPHFAALLKRLTGMLVGLYVGAWLGAGILTGANAGRAALGLGLALIAYAALGLSNLRFSIARSAEIWVGPLVGVATGIVMAATGIFVIPALPYLHAIGLEKDELVQALGIHFTISTFALAAVLWSGNAFDSGLGILSLVAILPAIVGMMIGQRVRKNVSVETFRFWLFIALLVLGGQLVFRHLF